MTPTIIRKDCEASRNHLCAPGPCASIQSCLWDEGNAGVTHTGFPESALKLMARMLSPTFLKLPGWGLHICRGEAKPGELLPQAASGRSREGPRQVFMLGPSAQVGWTAEPQQAFELLPHPRAYCRAAGLLVYCFVVLQTSLRL